MRARSSFSVRFRCSIRWRLVVRREMRFGEMVDVRDEKELEKTRKRRRGAIYRKKKVNNKKKKRSENFYLRWLTFYFGIWEHWYRARLTWKRDLWCEEDKLSRPADEKLALNWNVGKMSVLLDVFVQEIVKSIFVLLFSQLYLLPVTHQPASSTLLWCQSNVKAWYGELFNVVPTV